MSETAFVNWIVKSPRRVGGLFVSILYVLVVAGQNLSHAIPALKDLNTHKTFYSAVPSALQCLALLPPLWQCARIAPPESLRAGHPVAIEACRQFAKCLTALIATWILFYFLIFLSQVNVMHGQEPWVDFLNNLQATFLFACYWTLTAITVSEKDEHGSISLSLVLNFSLWFVLVFHLADLFLSRSGSTSTRFWFQLLSGLAVGVCMGLLVGCLESEYLNAAGTRILTACLYSYAVLQLAYLGFNPPVGSSPSPVERFLEEFATITSLPLKLLLIAFCYWAVQDGRLAFYMERTRALIRDVPDQWKHFSSI